MVNSIIKELDSYKSQSIDIAEGITFSAYRLCRRIMLYKTQTYPTGKFDSQGNTKYWFDIISPRVNSEIKNIDFDTKDIILSSEGKNDGILVMLAIVAMRYWLKITGQGEKLNEAIEQGAEWGNVVWKKVKGDYKIMDLNNLMVLNQTAKTLEDSDVIEQEVVLSIDLRKKKDIWSNVDELLKTTRKDDKKSSPEFYIYERNGEISEKEYYDTKAKANGSIPKKGDENKYLLTKVIVGGIEKYKPTQVLFCEEISEKPYKEYHRGTYSGTWLRVGLYQILFDIQTRGNEIGNQIARGLEWASKTIFRSSDKVIAQNILTDLQNGDIIKSVDLTQVPTRMEGLDQLIADWNRLMTLADQLANSYEVIMGVTPASGTPLGTSQLLNQNAGKLFDFIREKLGLALQDVIEEWVLPSLLKDLNKKKILRLTGDSEILNKYYTALVDDWYIRNLLAFPPHGEEEAQFIKQQKLSELAKKDETTIELEDGLWDDFKPRVQVVITGENVNLKAEMDQLASFIALEGDPIRRTALLEMALKKANIDISSLPKSPPLPAPTEGAVNSGGGSPMDGILQNQKKQLATR